MLIPRWDGWWSRLGSNQARIVPMRALESVSGVRCLHHDNKLRFKSPLLAQAFDALHEKTWAESWPEAEDWMA